MYDSGETFKVSIEGMGFFSATAINENASTRTGDSKEAIRIFGIMEDLYQHLYPFAAFDKIVKEARRKLDVNRILVEDVRAALTEEIRRADLIDAIRKLRK